MWQTTVGTGLNGKTLGVYAPGRIGSCVAQVGKAFGMKVTCWGRDASKAKARELGYEVPASREEFFASADVISLHIPLNKETRGIVTAADLASPKQAFLLPVAVPMSPSGRHGRVGCVCPCPRAKAATTKPKLQPKRRDYMPATGPDTCLRHGIE